MACVVRALRGLIFLASALFLVSLLSVPDTSAQTYGPRLRIEEAVTGEYYWNGNVSTDASRTGQFFVGVPNDEDVLQYVYVELNDGFTQYTELQNTKAAYNDVITSQPDPWDWERLYCNTTSNDDDINYVINDSDQAPTLNLSMYWSNELGGSDLYDENNIQQSYNNMTVVFSITNPSSTKNLAGIDAYINLRTDTNGTAEPHVMAVSAQSGSPSAVSSDGADGYSDRITWTGITVNAGTTVNLTAYINITGGVHITGTTDNYIMQPATGNGMESNWDSTGELFSEISPSTKFARGPVRQGVDLSVSDGYWYVRGFIRNLGYATVGQNLTYNITSWAIYEVDPSTGAPYSSSNQSGDFDEVPGTTNLIVPSDGRIYTTNDSRSSNKTLYNTSSTTKPFISVSWDWQVVWNSTSPDENYTTINTTMLLPTLYMVDLTGVKTASGTLSPEVGGENVTINDTLTNVGHTETNPSFVQILSTVPSNTSGNEFRDSGDSNSNSWLIQNDVDIWYNGNTQIANDSANCVLIITQTSEAADGLVNLTVNNLDLCDLVGGGTVGGSGIFDEGDTLRLSYRVTSDVDMTTGDSYTFSGIGQLTSDTGTVDREYFTNTTVAAAGKRLIGYKDLVAYDVDTPTLINTTINISVQDDTALGIAGIKFIDYVPDVISAANFIGNFTSGAFSLVMNGATMTYGSDYTITDNGTQQLPDGLTVRVFEFVNESGGTWTLDDGEYIQVMYQLNYTTPGAYLLPVTIAAFDPDTGASLSTAFYGVVKVQIPEPNIALVIDETDLVQSKTVLVGKPAQWNKEFDVYNPNPRQVPTTFEADIFEDASDGYVTYFDEDGRRVEESAIITKDSQGRAVISWQTIMNPYENRNYEVVVLTPPVLEIDRDVEVLEQLPNKKVRLKMDVFLKSFAKEDYENLILNLPISYENIEEVRDGFGNRIAFTGGADTSTITVDSIASDEMKTVSVVYQESYPTIIITPDRDRYNLNSPVSLEVLVINGGEKIDYPYLELEIYTPGMDVVFTNIQKLEEMEPLEKTQTYEKFVIPASAPEGMYIASAKFREDFATLASTTGNFYVVGVEGGLPQSLELVMVVLVAGILVFFSWRRIKEVRKSGPNKYGGA